MPSRPDGGSSRDAAPRFSSEAPSGREAEAGESLAESAAQLARAELSARRLARARRVLVTLLGGLTLVIAALCRGPFAGRGAAPWRLGLLWCFLFLPTVKVLAFELLNHRQLERLRARRQRR